MDRNTKGFIAYWRNSLADAEFGKGALENEEIKKFSDWNNITDGRLDKEIVDDYFRNESEKTDTVRVMLRPKLWRRRSQHGKERTGGAPIVVTPLVITAHLNRFGFLFPLASATVARDLLEPLVKGSFSIGEISQYDKYKTIHHSIIFDEISEEQYRTENDEQLAKRYQKHHQQWQSYLNEAQHLLDNVAGEWLKVACEQIRAIRFWLYY